MVLLLPSLRRCGARLALGLIPLALTGCALTSTAPSTPESYTGASIQGVLHGGQAPIIGAKVYLMQANTTGYGQPSISILTSGAGTDTIGTYVTTGTHGNFSITGDYSCTANTQIYLYGLGGNSGSSANNSASGLLAALGNCPASGSFLGTFPNIQVNEITTIAAAYAFAGFATDALHVSSPATTLAQTGIANAFLNASNLASIVTGDAVATTAAGNGTAPQGEVYTLANILAACVNTVGPSSGPCSTLLSDATSNGTATGTVATDTATAAIYIAHNPGLNIAALYNLQTAASPFPNGVTTQPNDFTLALTFRGNQTGTGGGLGAPESVAIDAAGNAWMTTYGTFYGHPGSLCKFGPQGADLLSNASTFTACVYGTGGLDDSNAIAIDTSGNVWAGNSNASISEFNSAGVALSGSSGYTGGGVNSPNEGIAVDIAGNIWTANGGASNSLSEFDSSGNPKSPVAGYTGAGLYEPRFLAFDASNNVWATNYEANATTYYYSVSKFDDNGNPLANYPTTSTSIPYGIAIDSGGDAWIGNVTANFPTSILELSSTGSVLKTETNGGLDWPISVAIDGAGNVWAANSMGSLLCVSEFNSAGVAITGSTGYSSILSTSTYSPRVYYPSLNSIAIDGSGDVWTVGSSYLGLIEFIGAATPVVTPIVANLLPPYGKPASMP